MQEKKNILTYEGLRKYEDELHDLKVVKRQEVAQKIKEAREQGDLSENAEYDAAKDEQRDIEARIEELEKILKNAEVVDEDEVDLDKISRANYPKGTFALVAGMMEGAKKNGFQTAGFDAYVSTNVIAAAGVSSSASFLILENPLHWLIYSNMKGSPELGGPFVSYGVWLRQTPPPPRRIKTL